MAKRRSVQEVAEPQQNAAHPVAEKSTDAHTGVVGVPQLSARVRIVIARARLRALRAANPLTFERCDSIARSKGYSVERNRTNGRDEFLVFNPDAGVLLTSVGDLAGLEQFVLTAPNIGNRLCPDSEHLAREVIADTEYRVSESGGEIIFTRHGKVSARAPFWSQALLTAVQLRRHVDRTGVAA